MNPITPSHTHFSPSAVRAAALAAHAEGLCVFPPREDGSKQPDASRWKQYQTARPGLDYLRRLYANGRTGLGIFCGLVSGNLEAFEFDDSASVYQAFKDAATVAGLADVVERIEAGYLERSPSGGVHWLWRSAEIGRNTLLAKRRKRAEERRRLPDGTPDPHDAWQVLIETRAAGGYVIVAPSYGTVHPSGQSYCLLRGGFATITEITPEERADLFALARSFDQDETKRRPDPAPKTGRTLRCGNRPGDRFNIAASLDDIRAILKRAGWTYVYRRGEEEFWRRPGKDRGISATLNFQRVGLVHVFSSSTPFPESNKSYSPFAVLAYLEHGGDFRAAAQDLERRAGIIPLRSATALPSLRVREVRRA